MLNASQRQFLESQRVARLASANAAGEPHVIPICFALVDATLYFTVDQKPKRTSELKRLRNIRENPSVAVIVDRYDDDWTRLGWVLLRGQAEVIEAGDEHARAQTALRERYTQYQTMQLDALPVVAIRIERVTSWGNLES